ncbi:MAG TPA: beta-lactamase family protein [Anaerolineae bacterium]|nr:beta-lactamase family protein [Anaerolineae bacterium]
MISAACTILLAKDAEWIVDELEADIPPVVADGNSPSIQVAVVHQGRIAWSEAFGEDSSVDHVYMNASVQKTFTAVAILQLVERGLLDLDADVSQYVPFGIQHPDFPEIPITARMLLAHRSGLDEFPHQFGWDTESAFSPRYRPPCPPHLLNLSTEAFLIASLTPEGSNYTPGSWISEPDQEYHYSISAYPFLRYLIGQVSGQSYDAYMHENVFIPLGMTGSGFSADAFAERHVLPYTRIGGENVELPIWNGQGWMMHTTAEDMARFMLALMNQGRYGDFDLLQPGMVELLQQSTTIFVEDFQEGGDLPLTGHGLGLFSFRGGWFGNGGSAPGFQCLLRFHPSRGVGYVILSNVNAILGSGWELDSVRSDIYTVQDALLSILDPTLKLRGQERRILLLIATVSTFLIMVLWIRLSLKRRARQKEENAA